MESVVERQELYCHGCGNYVQFDMDLSLNGNHVLECPKCGHEHCRVVRDGRITDIRWDRRNNNVIAVPTYNITYSSTSTWDNYTNNYSPTASVNDRSNRQTNSTGSSTFLYSSWMNSYNSTRWN